MITDLKFLREWIRLPFCSCAGAVVSVDHNGRKRGSIFGHQPFVNGALDKLNEVCRENTSQRHCIFCGAPLGLKHRKAENSDMLCPQCGWVVIFSKGESNGR